MDEPARPAAKPSDARFVLKRVVITGNTVFAQETLLALLEDTIGKEVGFAELEAAAARISSYYRERGYLVARAYLPAQDIKDGSVEIADALLAAGAAKQARAIVANHRLRTLSPVRESFA